MTSLSHTGPAVTDRWEWKHPSVTWACLRQRDEKIVIPRGFGRKSAHFAGFPSKNLTAYGNGETTDVIRHINIYGNMIWLDTELYLDKNIMGMNERFTFITPVTAPA